MSVPVHRRTVSVADVPLGPGLGILRVELDGETLTLQKGHGGGQEPHAVLDVASAPLRLPSEALDPIRAALDALAVESGPEPGEEAPEP